MGSLAFALRIPPPLTLPTRGGRLPLALISENCLPFDAKEENKGAGERPSPCGEG